MRERLIRWLIFGLLICLLPSRAEAGRQYIQIWCNGHGGPRLDNGDISYYVESELFPGDTFTGIDLMYLDGNLDIDKVLNGSWPPPDDRNYAQLKALLPKIKDTFKRHCTDCDVVRKSSFCTKGDPVCDKQCSDEVKDQLDMLAKMRAAQSLFEPTDDQKYPQQLGRQIQDLVNQISDHLAECQAWCKGRRSDEGNARAASDECDRMKQKLEDTADEYETISKTCDTWIKDILSAGIGIGGVVGKIKPGRATFYAAAAVISGRACENFFESRAQNYRDLAKNLVCVKVGQRWRQANPSVITTYGSYQTAELAIKNEAMVQPTRLISPSRGYAGEYQSSALNPPSSNFQDVVKPVIEPVVRKQGASETEQRAVAVIEAQRWHEAYLKAYVTSYERYQGAKAVKDNTAMIRQARAMLKFAGLAAQASRNENIGLSDLENLTLKNFEESLLALQSKGIPWEDVFLQGRKRIELEGLPPEFHKALVDFKLSEAEIKNYENYLKALSPERMKEVLARMKMRVQMTTKIRTSLAARGLDSTWPEPPDIVTLIQMQQYANLLMQTARAMAGSLPRRRATP